MGRHGENGGSDAVALRAQQERVAEVATRAVRARRGSRQQWRRQTIPVPHSRAYMLGPWYRPEYGPVHQKAGKPRRYPVVRAWSRAGQETKIQTLQNKGTDREPFGPWNRYILCHHYHVSVGRDSSSLWYTLNNWPPAKTPPLLSFLLSISPLDVVRTIC